MITNKNRMPDVDFLPDNKIHPIGNIGGTRLVLLGKEKGTNVAVVSRSYTAEFDPDEELFAIPLYELISHSQESIELTEDI
ncbi:MAG: hypothetical protein KME52_18535 [Desmonostoc geniculatum HA4340-LM1]|jgi:hypothetical protein|nr:hypothetical protein [Desmonostoc geniculatum HA4340-LM1]